MQEFYREIKRTLIKLMVWGITAVLLLVWLDLKMLVAGFLFGLGTSAVYYLLMCYRVKKSIGLPITKAVSSMRVGWLIRLCFTLFMLILAVKLEQINIWAAVAGMFSLHVMLIFNTIATIINSAARKGRA